MLCSWGVKTGIGNVLGGIENYVTVRPDYVIATTLKPAATWLSEDRPRIFILHSSLSCLLCVAISE